ncbi:MAG: S4 domain-containing protein, partial [bacterium]
TEIAREKFEEGYYIVHLLKDINLASSSSEARRLIKQGGIYLEEEQINDMGLDVTLEHFNDDETIMLRKGKKTYHQIVLK